MPLLPKPFSHRQLASTAEFRLYLISMDPLCDCDAVLSILSAEPAPVQQISRGKRDMMAMEDAKPRQHAAAAAAPAEPEQVHKCKWVSLLSSFFKPLVASLSPQQRPLSLQSLCSGMASEEHAFKDSYDNHQA